MVNVRVSDDWIFVEMRAEVKPQSLVTVESDAFIFQKIRPELVLFVMMAFGLAFCVLTAFPVVCFIRIIAAAKNLPSWARVETGEVSKLCSGAMTCAVVLTLLSAWTAWCRHDLVSKAL